MCVGGNTYRAMYCSCCALGPISAKVRPAEVGTVLATWAPERARRRKRHVPTNSPVVAFEEGVSEPAGVNERMAAGAYDEVIPNGVRDLVEDWYTHDGIFVEGRVGVVAVVAAFVEEGEGETVAFQGGLCWLKG